MSVSYFVFYKGQAEEPGGFVERYRKVHVPILQRWPGVLRVMVHTPLPAQDPKSTSSAGLAMMAEIVFRDQAALASALASQERHEARLDFANFPLFHGDVLHQPMQSEAFQPASAAPHSENSGGAGQP